MADDSDELLADVAKIASGERVSGEWPPGPGDLLVEVAATGASCDEPTLAVYAEQSAAGVRSLRFVIESVGGGPPVPDFVIDDVGRLHELTTGLLDGWNWLRGQGS